MYAPRKPQERRCRQKPTWIASSLKNLVFSPLRDFFCTEAFLYIKAPYIRPSVHDLSRNRLKSLKTSGYTFLELFSLFALYTHNTVYTAYIHTLCVCSCVCVCVNSVERGLKGGNLRAPLFVGVGAESPHHCKNTHKIRINTWNPR